MRLWIVSSRFTRSQDPGRSSIFDKVHTKGKDQGGSSIIKETKI